jgi:hypothetical protein
MACVTSPWHGAANFLDALLAVADESEDDADFNICERAERLRGNEAA